MSQQRNRGPKPKRTCPSEQEWMELAAGLKSPTETHDRLEHATECPSCAKLLKRVAEQFAEEIADEEMKALGGLKSAGNDWPKNLPHRMQVDLASHSHPSFRKRSWEPR